MNTQINLYDLLGVKTDADEVEIKRAYRKLAAKTHPDVGGEAMASLFMGIQKAYETLSDPKLRADYDRSLNAPQEHTQRSEAPEHEARRRTHPKNDTPPSYEWEWTTTVIPANGIALFAKAAKEDGKRFIKERYTQRFPFKAIFFGALVLWLVSLMLRNITPIPETLTDSPITKITGVLQLAHIAVVAVAVASKKLKALKAIIAVLIGLLPLLAPTILNIAITRSPEFSSPSPMALIATITLSISALAIIWSLNEQGTRKKKLKAAGIPRRVNDWTLINASRSETQNRAARHAEIISQMVASKLPGTKIFLNAAISPKTRIPLLVVNGNSAALVEVMDASSANLPDDITTYQWDAFRWEESSLDDKPLALQKALPEHVKIKTFLMVYPAHTGSHTASYSIGKDMVQVDAVSDVELGNLMGSWLAEGNSAGAVDTDLTYRLMTGRSLSTLR